MKYITNNMSYSTKYKVLIENFREKWAEEPLIWIKREHFYPLMQEISGNEVNGLDMDFYDEFVPEMLFGVEVGGLSHKPYCERKNTVRYKMTKALEFK